MVRAVEMGVSWAWSWATSYTSDGAGQGESTSGIWHTASVKVLAGVNGVLVRLFLERLLETVRKKDEYSVSSWRS